MKREKSLKRPDLGRLGIFNSIQMNDLYKNRNYISYNVYYVNFIYFHHVIVLGLKLYNFNQQK